MNYPALFALAIALMAVPSGAQLPADAVSAREVIAPMSALYRAMQPSMMVRGLIDRRTSRGERSQETKREYRLLQGGGAVRADVCGTSRSQSCAIYIRRREEVVLFLPESREFAVLKKTDPAADAIQAALGRVQIALYGRFVDLAATNYRITGVKEAELKIGGQKKRCYHIKLKPGEGEKSTWTAELWIEKDSALVWRATLVRQDEGERLEETVTWLEIKSGSDVPIAELEWRPPADAKRFERVPSGALPQ